jgi:hypothetical protein
MPLDFFNRVFFQVDKIPLKLYECAETGLLPSLVLQSPEQPDYWRFEVAIQLSDNRCGPLFVSVSFQSQIFVSNIL